MGIVRRWSSDEDEKLRELARAGKASQASVT